MMREVPVQRNNEVRLLPVVFICRRGQSPQVFKAAVEFVWLESNKISSSTLRIEIAAVTRLLNFVSAYFYMYPFRKEHFEDFVTHFVSTRVTGTLDEDMRCRYGSLNWRKVVPQTARMELLYILKFMDFCAERSGEFSVSGLFRVKLDKTTFAKQKEMKDESANDFLAHLIGSREYWKKIRGEEETRLPDITPKVLKKPKSYARTPSVAEVVAIIRATPNPVYKAIFILAAFGGLRISEIVNLWVCDVMPGDYYSKFFSDPLAEGIGECMVLRCHPVHSTYCGKINEFGISRAEFLRTLFDLKPRPLLSSQDRLYAGWKGTISTGAGLVHPVFWTDPEAPQLFHDCYQSILKVNRHIEADKRHPYLFINIADRSIRSLGLPTTIESAQRAFHRSCARTDLTYGLEGLTIHGLRHFYKWYATDQLKIKPHHVQIMMGHESVRSQDDYGVRVSEIGERVLEARRTLQGSAAHDL